MGWGSPTAQTLFFHEAKQTSVQDFGQQLLSNANSPQSFCSTAYKEPSRGGNARQGRVAGPSRERYNHRQWLEAKSR